MQENQKKDIQEEFRLFWVIACKKYGLNSELKDAVWIHLQATGNDKKEKFLDGLKSFGFKI